MLSPAAVCELFPSPPRRAGQPPLRSLRSASASPSAGANPPWERGTSRQTAGQWWWVQRGCGEALGLCGGPRCPPGVAGSRVRPGAVPVAAAAPAAYGGTGSAAAPAAVGTGSLRPPALLLMGTAESRRSKLCFAAGQRHAGSYSYNNHIAKVGGHILTKLGFTCKNKDAAISDCKEWPLLVSPQGGEPLAASETPNGDARNFLKSPVTR